MKRFVKTALGMALVAISVNASAADNNVTVTPQERAKIEMVVQQYLMQKPEVIMQAVQSLQQKQYQEAEKTVKKTQQNAYTFSKELFKQPNDPVAGNPNGKITVTEFFDYQCPHCVDMAPVIADIIKANPDVRVIFKEFPIRGPMSEVAARAALAANMQGKYYVFSHALLMSKTQPLTQDVIIQIAKTNGLDVDKLKKDMDSAAVTAQLKTTMQLAQKLSLFGTPAMFIGKTDASGAGSVVYVPGQMSQAQLQKAIDDAQK